MEKLQMIPMPYFIPVDSSGGGGEFTNKDGFIFLSIFIGINMLWIISLLITLYRYKILKSKDYCNNRYESYLKIRQDGIGMLVNILMIFTWSIFLIVIVSMFVYNSFN